MSFLGYLTPGGVFLWLFDTAPFFFRDIKIIRDIRDIRDIEIDRFVKDIRDTKDSKNTIVFRVNKKIMFTIYIRLNRIL